jgi:hypothetical protein
MRERGACVLRRRHALFSLVCLFHPATCLAVELGIRFNCPALIPAATMCPDLPVPAHLRLSTYYRLLRFMFSQVFQLRPP